MNNIDFWKNWNYKHKWGLFISSLLLGCFVIISIYLSVTGTSFFLDWKVKGFLEEYSFIMYSEHSDYIETNLNIGVPLILQKAIATYTLPSYTFTIFLPVVLYISLCVMLAVSSFLNRFWFIVCMGFVVVIVALSGISQIGLFGFSNEVSIGFTSLLVIGLAYYYHEFNSQVGLWTRVTTFTLLFAGFLVCTMLFSSVDYPLMTVIVNSYWLVMVLSILFILWIGHEIVYGILVLTTKSSTGDGSGGWHFIVFALVYLINVALIYMHNAKYIDWDIYYFSPFVLLSLSTILSIWGLRDRQLLYENILPFHPYALVFFFSMSFICYAGCIHFFLSSNDSALEVLEDFIIFGHIGFGGMFFLYVVINFLTLLMKGLPIYKIAFKEDNFPYVTSKLAGVIVVAAFFFSSNYVPWHQAVSGYMNELGDISLIQNQHDLAKEYYRKGAISGNMLGQSNQNHKSNFMYAMLNSDLDVQLKWFKNAAKDRATEQSFVGLATSYENGNRFFDAMFTYQDGLRVYPESWALNNNLALLYHQIGIGDSAMYYLSKENNSDDWQSSIMTSNRLIVSDSMSWVLENQVTESDLERIDIQTNLLYAHIVNDVKDVDSNLISELDLRLNLFSSSYLKNLGLMNLKSGSNEYLDHIDSFLKEGENEDYFFSLSLIKAMNLYNQGKVAGAYILMNDLAEKNYQFMPYVKMILGKWSMELGSPLLAAQYFETARENGYPMSTIDLAHAYAHTDRSSIARYLLSKESESLDTLDIQLRASVKKLEAAIADGENTWRHDFYDYGREMELLAKINKDSALMSTEERTNVLMQLGTDNPFFEKGVLEAVNHFNVLLNGKDIAYEFLVEAIFINEYSSDLLKSYIDQCLIMGLMSYAESALVKLGDIMDAETYENYEILYDRKKQEIESSVDNW